MRLSWLVLMVGCAARIPIEVPAAPIVAVPTRSVAVVADNRECRPVADRLTDELRSSGLEVRPDALASVTVFGCNHSWSTHRDGAIEGRAQGIAMLSIQGENTAHLLGASKHIEPLDNDAPLLNRHRKTIERSLDQRVARDLAEQIAPAPLPVRRRVYTNTSVGSARSFHNLAVVAEQEGRLIDALWWAQRAHERHPSSLRARYVEELSRRVSRTGRIPL